MPEPEVLGSAAVALIGLTARDRWSRTRLEAYQARRLRELRALAYARSPFYRAFHANREQSPLEALPILTAEHAAALAAETEAADPRRRTRWCTTSGSTGAPSRIGYGPRDWGALLAGFARARAWAGVATLPWLRLRTAVVASGDASHVSHAVAASLRSWAVPMLPMDAGAPLADLSRQLNAARPEILITYPSVGGALARAQHAGSLQIAPRLVVSVAETLTVATRTAMTAAWACPVVDQYTTTEAGCLAAECQPHGGLHLQEDLAIVEVVDEHHRRVPAGRSGDHVLVTPLFNATMPLFRYQLTDRVQLSDRPCPCGRPFQVVERIEGRTEELLPCRTSAGAWTEVHPVVVYEVLDALPITSWQLEVSPAIIRARLAGADPTLLATAHERLTAAFAKRGLLPSSLVVESTDEVPRTWSAKRVALSRTA